MLVLVIEILEMLVLVIKFRICIYEITIHNLKNVTLLLRHIVFVVDDARPASSSSTRSRQRPTSEDPYLLWWRSRGQLSVRRELALPEVVRHRVKEEDEHVRRYMASMDVRFSNTSQVLWGSHPSYDPMVVPSLWVSTAHASGTASELDNSTVFDLYYLASDVFNNIRDDVYSRLYILFDNMRDDDVFEIIFDDAYYLL